MSLPVPRTVMPWWGVLALLGNIAFCWCVSGPGMLGDRNIQAASIVLLQQQSSTAMQHACWNISPCLLHCYLYSWCIPISLLPFHPAATKWYQRGTQLVIKHVLPSFVFPAFAFTAKGPLCSWWNNAIKTPQPFPYWPLGGSLNTAYSLAALAAFN